jgi:uncharacterized protein DUF3800
MVAVFIDESGNFRTTPLSVVAALSLPHRCLSRVRRELTRKTADWPKIDDELKGGQLSVEHLLILVDILVRHQALLHGVVATVGAANDSEIEAHRKRQCELTTRNLTPEHHADLVAAVWKLRQVLERMSNQLYTQFVAQTHLLCAIIEEVPTYFSQRRPKELELFEWFVDAKDKDVTPQEIWWRKSLAPMIQSRSRREPFARVKDDGFNYKYFEKAYGFQPEAADASAAGERNEPISIDVGLLVTKRLHFPNSKDDILIQVADILARAIRRVLTDRNPDLRLVKALGRLQIRRKHSGGFQSLRLMSLAERAPEVQHLADVVDHMARVGRPMILK